MPDLSDKVSELLPCPFCGHGAELFTPEDMGGDYSIVCGGKDCCTTQGRWLTADAAIAAWNRRTRPAASSMEGWRPQAPMPVINIHLDEPLGEFKPCQLILREAGITEYVYEDCPTVAVPVVAGAYHAVDWMVSFDGRLVGIQFWQIHPELAASPIPPEVMK